MHRLTGALLAFTVLTAAATCLEGQSSSPQETGAVVPGSELRVWLMTAGPGEAVWERFGHNALRVLDTSTGEDVAYNWGIFDFNQVDFLPRFLKGEMLYMMAPFQSGPMVDAYAQAGRQIVLQELALTPAQRLALRDLARENARPENREYYYDYFLDNCSTRVRDLLDRVLGGDLDRRFGEAGTGTSFRYHIRRLTRTDPLLFTGMDVLLGTPGDRPISLWEEMFLPMTLRDALRDVTVVGDDGVARPLVLTEEVVVPGPPSGDPESPPSWFVAYLVMGLALGGLVAWSGTRAASGSAWGRRVFTLLTTLWSALAGFVGTILVLVLFTDHTFMAWNENLFLLTPLSLALVLLLPLAQRSAAARTTAYRTSTAMVVIAMIGVVGKLLPALNQANAIFIALVLPVHLALWWALRTQVAAAARQG